MTKLARVSRALVLACCALTTWLDKPVDSFWFTDTNFQPAQAKVLPMIKSAPERPNMSAESSFGSLLQQSPPASADDNNKQCSCSLEWFERQLDLSLRSQFTKHFVKIADEELKKEARAKNLSQDLFGPFKDLIPLFDRLLLLNRLRSDATLLGSRSHAPPANNEIEEIWINFRPAEAANIQQQLQPPKYNHVLGSVKSPVDQAGIIRVKDRETLFDMKSKVNDRLVLVESEQLLVVNSGLGWRPLQMQPALRDIRLGWAKYGLHSNEERQRLLESSVVKKPPAVDYLAKARESDASLPNYYHDRSSTSSADEDEDDADDQDEDDEDDEDEDADMDDYFTGFSLLDSGGKSLKGNRDEPRVASSTVASTVAPEQPRHPSTMISHGPATVQSPARGLITDTRQPPILPLRRDNQQSSGSRQLRMAALNEPFTGSIHGIRGADFECSKAARKASIKGSFKAFLASGYQNLNELLRHNVRNLPIVNLRNEELAGSWNDLFSKPSKLINPLSRIYSFDGRLVAADSNWPNKLVWHGVASSSGHRHNVHQCDGWHSNSKAKFGMASPLHTPRAHLAPVGAPKRKEQPHKRFSHGNPFNHHLNQTATRQPARVAALDGLDKYPCSMPLIVLCVETVGQTRESSASNYQDNYFDMDPRNMS